MLLSNTLLKAMYTGLNKESLAVPVLSIDNTDKTVKVLIKTEPYGQKTLIVTQDEITQISIDLTQKQLTFNDLADQFNQYFGSNNISIIIDRNQLIRSLRTLVAIDYDKELSQYTLSSYTSLLWIILDTYALELEAAKAAINEAIKQVYLHLSESNWLDEWASYFDFNRNVFKKETDDTFRDRMIDSIIRPKCNNIALEITLSDYYDQDTKVVDATGESVNNAPPRVWDKLIFHYYNGRCGYYDGSINYKPSISTETDLSSDSTLPTAGIFNVEMPFDLLGAADKTEFIINATKLINKIKAAGTKLGAFKLISTSPLSDTVELELIEAAQVSIVMSHYYNNTWRYNGKIMYKPDLTNEVL